MINKQYDELWKWKVGLKLYVIFLIAYIIIAFLVEIVPREYTNVFSLFLHIGRSAIFIVPLLLFFSYLYYYSDEIFKSYKNKH